MATVLRRAAWCGGVALVLALLWTAGVLLSVRTELGAAKGHLERAAEAETPREAARGLRSAEARLARAGDRLRQPGPRLVAVLPVFGRTVDAVRVSTAATLGVTTTAQQLLEAAPEDLVGGRVDVARLREVGDAARRGAARTRRPVERLADLDLGLVPGVVARPVRQVQRRLAPAPAGFAALSSAMDGLTPLLGSPRPRSVLVMLQNNAELRGTGGIVTVFAQATARDGRLDLEAFRDVQEVADSADEVQRVRTPADYRALWGPFLADSTLWLNVNMTPDVPTASGVLAEVAVASGLPRPDAVLWFDVPGIARLLEATGPVRLPDGTLLDAGNAVRVLLSEAYAGAVDTREGQAARRAALRGAADAVLGRLLGGDAKDVSAPRLGRALADAAAGRHLALWSADPQEQRSLELGGLAGQVRAGAGDLSAVALQNFGGGNRQGNKLDYYARRQVTVRVRVDEDHAVVEQELGLRNTAPAQGLPAYVAGEVEPGTTRNYVTLALPAGAERVSLQRGERPVDPALRRTGDHAVAVDGTTLPPGATATWRLRYRLPLEDGRYALQLVPQPLAVDAGLRVEVRAADGLRLVGQDVHEGEVVLSAAFTRGRTVSVQAREPNVLRRALTAVRRFWTEPVRLP